MPNSIFYSQPFGKSMGGGPNGRPRVKDFDFLKLLKTAMNFVFRVFSDMGKVYYCLLLVFLLFR